MDKATAFLGDDPNVALGALNEVFKEHVLPFLSGWWDPDGAIPTAEEIAALQAAILRRASESPLPPSYEHLPELLRRLAEGLRFNRRNYVNIYPSPFVPSTLASFVASIQNPNNIVEEVSKATTAMEHEAVAWMAKNLFGLVESSGFWAMSYRAERLLTSLRCWLRETTPTTS